jgi:hypothetical protein
MPKEDLITDQAFSQSDPRFQAALGFTGGDGEKAKQMISGDYLDVRVIKGKYSIHSIGHYGNYMVFVNIATNAFLNISLISYSDKSFFEDFNPIISWKEYYKTCERIAGATSMLDVADLIPHLIASLEGYDITADLRAQDEANASATVSDILSRFYSSNTVENILHIDATSSLELQDERIPVKQVEIKKEQAEAAPADTRPEIEKKAAFVVEAKAIISPLKGKIVNDLMKGDMIVLLLVNRDGASIKIAEALGALDEERNFLPMKGRLVEKVPVEKIGYYLYCAIAKNALAKIPEEGNVQIEIADDTPKKTVEEVEKQNKASDKNMMMYVAMLIGLIILTAIVIYAIV